MIFQIDVKSINLKILYRELNYLEDHVSRISVDGININQETVWTGLEGSYLSRLRRYDGYGGNGQFYNHYGLIYAQIDQGQWVYGSYFNIRGVSKPPIFLHSPADADLITKIRYHRRDLTEKEAFLISKQFLEKLEDF